MSQLLECLRLAFPELSYAAGKTFSWSVQTRQVTYNPAGMRETWGTWSLLHETGHGLLVHADYQSDLELLHMEVAAWEKAKELGQAFGVQIDPNHIEDCLDTYRDWLHRRSTCPTCGSVSLQHNSTEYHCHNCNAMWQVSSSRFCRPYRQLIRS